MIEYSKFVQSSVNLDNVLSDQPTPAAVWTMLLGGLGLAGEAGEVADMIKKNYFHGKGIDLDDLILELGDVLWYLQLMCNELGVSLEYVMDKNIEKLEARRGKDGG